ncbi:hypothetical protein SINU_07840, partial [Sporolactobacillus inulinus CASD]
PKRRFSTEKIRVHHTWLEIKNRALFARFVLNLLRMLLHDLCFLRCVMKPLLWRFPFFRLEAKKVAQILSENVRTPMQHSVKLHRL